MEQYNTKKKKNQEGISHISRQDVSVNTVNDYVSCGTYIEFFETKDQTKRKVYQGIFCKNRFCPMCAWRKSRKDGMMIDVLLKYIEVEHRKAYIFVTLTAPNVDDFELRPEIGRYNKAFNKLLKRKEIIRINHGCIRKLEVTYNKKMDTYHPHFHCIFAVNKSYFKSRDYIKQGDWLTLWQECMNDDSITQVDVRRLDEKGASEIAKYSAKDSEYMINDHVFDVFYSALKRKQLITYNGLFKQVVAKYKSKDPEDMATMAVYKTIDETEYSYMVLYGWLDSYIEKQRREMSQQEYLAMKREAIDETSM